MQLKIVHHRQNFRSFVAVKTDVLETPDYMEQMIKRLSWAHFESWKTSDVYVQFY